MNFYASDIFLCSILTLHTFVTNITYIHFVCKVIKFFDAKLFPWASVCSSGPSISISWWTLSFVIFFFHYLLLLPHLFIFFIFLSRLFHSSVSSWGLRCLPIFFYIFIFFIFLFTSIEETFKTTKKKVL